MINEELLSIINKTGFHWLIDDFIEWKIVSSNTEESIVSDEELLKIRNFLYQENEGLEENEESHNRIFPVSDEENNNNYNEQKLKIFDILYKNDVSNEFMEYISSRLNDISNQLESISRNAESIGINKICFDENIEYDFNFIQSKLTDLIKNSD